MHGCHGADAIFGVGQAIALFAANSVGQIAIDIGDRKRKAFWMGYGNAGQTCRVTMQSAFAFLDDLGAPADPAKSSASSARQPKAGGLCPSIRAPTANGG